MSKAKILAGLATAFAEDVKDVGTNTTTFSQLFGENPIADPNLDGRSVTHLTAYNAVSESGFLRSLLSRNLKAPNR